MNKITPKQAIKILESYRYYEYCDNNEENEQAFDMAISALEQTNTAELSTKYNKDDLIQRETARRIIDSNRTKEQMLMMLASIPKVESTAEWIIDSYEVKCSNCGYLVWGSELNTYKEWKYCPICGSRMKGE